MVQQFKSGVETPTSTALKQFITVDSLLLKFAISSIFSVVPVMDLSVPLIFPMYHTTLLLIHLCRLLRCQLMKRKYVKISQVSYLTWYHHQMILTSQILLKVGVVCCFCLHYPVIGDLSCIGVVCVYVPSYTVTLT